jgi:hypothetical protein
LAPHSRVVARQLSRQSRDLVHISCHHSSSLLVS